MTTQPAPLDFELPMQITVALVAGATGGLFALFGHYANYRFKVVSHQKQARMDEVSKLYSHFMAVASDDLERAKDLEATLIFMPGDQGPARSEWVAEWQRIDKARHSARRKLWRLYFQIRLLERDANIKGAISDLASRQLFFMPVGRQSDTLFQQAWDNYKQRIRDYEDLIKATGDRVAAKYGA